MLKPFRLAILAHDAGKPIAARNREKHRQGEYNAKYGKDFLLQAGVGERMAELLVAAGGRGAELAFAARRSKSSDDKVALLTFSASVLKHFYDGKVPAIEQTRGFAQMCNIVNICDGGAYTPIRVRQRREYPGRRYIIGMQDHSTVALCTLSA